MHTRLVFWFLLSLPALILLLLYAKDQLSYGLFLHFSGQLSIAMLILASSTTPLRKVIPANWSRVLLRARRSIGVASFAYATLHTVAYLEYKWGAGLILLEGAQWDLLTGWAALAGLSILAATSNAAATRSRGARWQTLHRMVYPAAVLTCAHWLLASFNTVVAISVVCLSLAVQLLRLRANQ